VKWMAKLRDIFKAPFLRASAALFAASLLVLDFTRDQLIANAWEIATPYFLYMVTHPFAPVVCLGGSFLLFMGSARRAKAEYDKILADERNKNDVQLIALKNIVEQNNVIVRRAMDGWLIRSTLPRVYDHLDRLKALASEAKENLNQLDPNTESYGEDLRAILAKLNERREVVVDHLIRHDPLRVSVGPGEAEVEVAAAQNHFADGVDRAKFGAAWTSLEKEVENTFYLAEAIKTAARLNEMEFIRSSVSESLTIAQRSLRSGPTVQLQEEWEALRGEIRRGIR